MAKCMCMLFEEDWTQRHCMAGFMVLSSIWMHKWMVWKRGKWPGKGRKHLISYDVGMLVKIALVEVTSWVGITSGQIQRMFDSELLTGYYNILNGEVREDWQQVVDAQLESLVSKWWYNIEDYVILKITSTSIHAEEHVFENPSVEIPIEYGSQTITTKRA